jgi:hypothetical protein
MTQHPSTPAESFAASNANEHGVYIAMPHWLRRSAFYRGKTYKGRRVLFDLVWRVNRHKGGSDHRVKSGGYQAGQCVVTSEQLAKACGLDLEFATMDGATNAVKKILKSCRDAGMIDTQPLRNQSQGKIITQGTFVSLIDWTAYDRPDDYISSGEAHSLPNTCLKPWSNQLETQSFTWFPSWLRDNALGMGCREQQLVLTMMWMAGEEGGYEADVKRLAAESGVPVAEIADAMSEISEHHIFDTTHDERLGVYEWQLLDAHLYGPANDQGAELRGEVYELASTAHYAEPDPKATANLMALRDGTPDGTTDGTTGSTTDGTADGTPDGTSINTNGKTDMRTNRTPTDTYGTPTQQPTRRSEGPAQGLTPSPLSPAGVGSRSTPTAPSTIDFEQQAKAQSEPSVPPVAFPTPQARPTTTPPEDVDEAAAAQQMLAEQDAQQRAAEARLEEWPDG